MEGAAWESLLWSDKESSGNFWGRTYKWGPVWGNCVHTGRQSYWLCITGTKGWHDTASEMLMPRRWVLRNSEGKAYKSLFSSLTGSLLGWGIHMYRLHKSLGARPITALSTICRLSPILIGLCLQGSWHLKVMKIHLLSHKEFFNHLRLYHNKALHLSKYITYHWQSHTLLASPSLQSSQTGAGKGLLQVGHVP